jgi:molybdopterin-guanine dinucleotide biosynthesis protein A
LLVGIFVGGRGERMGGVAKGLLKTRTDGGREVTLIERALGEIRAALPEADVALVGDAAAYADLPLRTIADEPAGIGPLGGLRGLLLDAAARGHPQVLVVACDLPFISRRLLQRLASAEPTAQALVTVTDGFRNPLVARYDVAATTAGARTVFASGQRSLQRVLDHLGERARCLELDATEAAELVDWDTPSDAARPISGTIEKKDT